MPERHSGFGALQRAVMQEPGPNLRGLKALSVKMEPDIRKGPEANRWAEAKMVKA